MSEDVFIPHTDTNLKMNLDSHTIITVAPHFYSAKTERVLMWKLVLLYSTVLTINSKVLFVTFCSILNLPLTSYFQLVIF